MHIIDGVYFPGLFLEETSSFAQEDVSGEVSALLDDIKDTRDHLDDCIVDFVVAEQERKDLDLSDFGNKWVLDLRRLGAHSDFVKDKVAHGWRELDGFNVVPFPDSYLDD